MKTVTLKQLDSFLRSLSSEYDVYAPITLHDGTRSFGRMSEGPLAILGGRIPGKATRLFFICSFSIALQYPIL